MTQIKQLAPQDEFVGFYLLRELAIKQTNGTPPKDYFDLVLGDSSGQLSAKYWDASTTDKETFSYGAGEGSRDCAHLSREIANQSNQNEIGER